MNSRYVAAAERAGHRCEYCHAPEVIFNLPFEVEHVRPRSRYGSDDEANLALACRACNLFKSDQQTGWDETINEVVLLFNPRSDHWEEHFRVDPEDGAIHGMSSIGRVTVSILRMNRELQRVARQAWMKLGLYP